MRPARSGQSGSVYVEALVGVAILAVALIPILGSFAVTPAALDQAAGYAGALNLARGELEALHALSGPEWDALTDEGPHPAGAGYTLQREVSLSPEAPDLKEVRVTVTWTDSRGHPGSVTLTTLVARRP